MKVALVIAAVGLAFAAGHAVGKKQAIAQCADADERRRFALDVADVAFDVGDTTKNVALVAMAYCRDKFPLPPMVP